MCCCANLRGGVFIVAEGDWGGGGVVAGRIIICVCGGFCASGGVVRKAMSLCSTILEKSYSVWPVAEYPYCGAEDSEGYGDVENEVVE